MSCLEHKSIGITIYEQFYLNINSYNTNDKQEKVIGCVIKIQF